MGIFDRWFRKTPGMTPDLAAEIRRSFEEASTDEEHFPSDIDRRILHVRVVLEAMGDMRSGRVLDLGCGKGRFSKIFASENPGAKVVALDLAVSMLGYAPQSLERVAASMLDLPFPDKSFDGAWATESLEHAVDVERAVSELCRVLKPDAPLVIIDKNAAHWGRLETPKWERWFHRAELEKMLRGHCSHVESREISYWEDVQPDGLFLVWIARK